MSSTLTLEGIAVTLGGRGILAPTRLSFTPGLTLVIGPNGAGKSTLLKAILGLVPASGRTLLDGVPLTSLPPARRARAIAYLPQGHEAHWPLPARAIVALGRFPHGSSDPDRLSPADAAAVETAMAAAEVAHLAARDVTTLSGGERARVALARVLAVKALVLLCDEPTAALDPGHQLGVLAILRAQARAGATILGVTHDLALAARFADRILLMHEGRVIAHGPPAAVLTAERLREVYGITAFTATHDGTPVLLPWERVT